MSKVIMMPGQPDEFHSWRKKLEDLEFIPGEPRLDRLRTWEKLQERLLVNQPPKRQSLYWVAACLLAILLLTIPPGGYRNNYTKATMDQLAGSNGVGIGIGSPNKLPIPLKYKTLIKKDPAILQSSSPAPGLSLVNNFARSRQPDPSLFHIRQFLANEKKKPGFMADTIAQHKTFPLFPLLLPRGMNKTNPNQQVNFKDQ